MKHSSNFTCSINIFRSALIILVMLFISNSASAQDVAPQPKGIEIENSVSSSEMELVLWFMGTKKCKTGAGFDDSIIQSQKKQIIKSGMTPNRILTRTFINKAMNYETTLV